MRQDQLSNYIFLNWLLKGKFVAISYFEFLQKYILALIHLFLNSYSYQLILMKIASHIYNNFLSWLFQQMECLKY